ncbi:MULTISPECIES: hypothetical protein [Paenibacillus]|uniref:Uncharacterized protein n=1 Tax=Paenibacillus odorifer TaxID=189426 RepID=A0A1R0XTF3_9BACL|nr:MULTISPECIES: hypothetical protein [Paenibacillus]AIQ37928.1 hypothetical protein R50345_26950 [Paenibacillus sp. FSL R5-0345]OMD38424.1 hypothetical protein BSK52_19410 [Paenibacillus odorifer]
MKRIKGMNNLTGAVLRSASGGSSSSGDKNTSSKAGSSHTAQQPASAQIYTAPSLDGGDDEYKKLISGKVDNNKPSFA